MRCVISRNYRDIEKSRDINPSLSPLRPQSISPCSRQGMAPLIIEMGGVTRTQRRFDQVASRAPIQLIFIHQQASHYGAEAYFGWPNALAIRLRMCSGVLMYSSNYLP